MNKKVAQFTVANSSSCDVNEASLRVLLEGSPSARYVRTFITQIVVPSFPTVNLCEAEHVDEATLSEKVTILG